MSEQKMPVTVHVVVRAPVEKVWIYWTEPQHIREWNAASDDWHTPEAINDLRIGGEFHWKMAARDKSVEFDFWGTYTEIVLEQRIAYTMGDDRKVQVIFEKTDEGVRITETFEPEQENSEEMQRAGWQAIMDRFKKYVGERESGQS